MSWVSDTVGARTFVTVRLRCAHRGLDGSVCNGRLLGSAPPDAKWPQAWQVYAMPLAAPSAASGRGPIQHCPTCHRVSEIVIRAA